MTFGTAARSALAAIAFAGSVALGDVPSEAPPIPVDIVEHEKIRLVLLDVVVTDRDGRTVPGLTREDFELVVRGEVVEVDTLDANCAPEAIDEPRAVRTPDRRPPVATGPEGRKTLLVFDYMHLYGHQRVAALEQAQAFLEASTGEDDEWLVAALTGGLRIEQGWTPDAGRARDALRRMQYDITLWNGNFNHLTETGFVQSLEVLLDVLAEVPGSKALVLFSAMQDYPLDRDFKLLASNAATSRCSIYPVDVRGFTPAYSEINSDADRLRRDFSGQVPLAPLSSLARLAMETGGRYTSNTNDLTLGVTRAQRDQACVYTVGFYDDPEEDRSQSIEVRVLRDGMRAHHPSAYLFRSPAAKRTTRIRAAYALPDEFDTGVVRAHIFPLQPRETDRWDALLAVSFPVPLGDTGGNAAVRDFGAVLARQRTVEHRFDRRVTLTPMSPDSRSTPTVTFVEQVVLRPGRYELTVVMADPESTEPHAQRLQVDVPPIPRQKLFLTQPVLGRPAGADLVVTNEAPQTGKKRKPPATPAGDRIGSERSFQPLVVTQLDEPADLVALTSVCMVGSGQLPEGTIRRALLPQAGENPGTLPAVPLELTAVGGRAKIRCQNLVDVLPASAIRGGDWIFEATIQTLAPDDVEPRSAQTRFTVAP